MIVMIWMQVLLAIASCVVAVVQLLLLAGTRVGAVCALIDALCLIGMAYILQILRSHYLKVII